ncbi:MAG: CoA pyrophosphatase [Gammaproteobacteria bacterium]|nr:CoA pyrophosphatase [Gammaproteobacteria bacterium]
MEFVERLRARLARPLPGESAQLGMAPLSRPRMREALAAASKVRQSAVLLCLFADAGEWRMVLMKRPDYDGTHAGQVSIPGGRLEPGESHQQAAFREFHEEMGTRVPERNLLGRLSPLFIPPSNFMVQPFVAHVDGRPGFDPDPVEVEAVVELSLARLLDETAVKRGKVTLSSGARMETPYFEVSGYCVWGATAMMLNEFKTVLRELC